MAPDYNPDLGPAASHAGVGVDDRSASQASNTMKRQRSHSPSLHAPVFVSLPHDELDGVFG